MKGIEQFGDLLAMGIGMFGALIKGLKNKLTGTTVILGMLIAGILTFSVTGVIELFYKDLSPKIVILISFCVGWIANEITEKLDLLVGDVYGIFIDWLKNKFKSKK
jgi:hypothetical protein